MKAFLRLPEASLVHTCVYAYKRTCVCGRHTRRVYLKDYVDRSITRSKLNVEIRLSDEVCLPSNAMTAAGHSVPQYTFHGRDHL